MLGGTGGLLLVLLLLFVVLFGGIGFHGQNPAPWSLGAVRTCCLVEPAATVLRRRGRSVDAKDWARAEDSRPARGGSELDATAELRRGGGSRRNPRSLRVRSSVLGVVWAEEGGGRLASRAGTATHTHSHTQQEEQLSPIRRGRPMGCRPTLTFRCSRLVRYATLVLMCRAGQHALLRCEEEVEGRAGGGWRKTEGRGSE